MSEPATTEDLARDLEDDLRSFLRFGGQPWPLWMAFHAERGWPSAIRRAIAAEGALLDIIQICGMAGIGEEGQYTLDRVNAMHAALGRQIARADAAEAEVERLKAMYEVTSRRLQRIRLAVEGEA